MANSSTASRSPAASAWWARSARSRLLSGDISQRRQNAGMEEPAARAARWPPEWPREPGRGRRPARRRYPAASPVDALVGLVQNRAGDAQQEVRVDRCTDDGRNIEDRSRLRGEPRRAGKDGVADRGRHGFAFGGQDLGHKERVAPGQPVQGGGIAATAVLPVAARPLPTTGGR